MNSVWVVTDSQQISRRLNQLIDEGRLSDANELYYSVQSFLEKIKSFCQARGCSVLLAMPDRCIMQLSTTAAEELPQIAETYMESFGGKLAIGIGLQFYEASEAAKKSVYSGEIEMFDPDEESKVFKREAPNSLAEQSSITLPPNMFDPDSPDNNEVEPPAKPKKKPAAVMRPPADHELRASQQMIGGVMQELGFPGMQQQQPEPRDLMEALNGGPMQGYQPPEPEQQSGGSSASSSEGSEEESLQSEVEQAEQEAEAFNGKLASMLANVKQQIPQIMGLAEKDPKAFKQALNVIQKLIAVAHQRKRVTKAQESEVEKLEKMFRRNQRGHIGGHHKRYPVGTRIGRRKKVLVDGKEVWRSMASGQVKDPQGKAVSVRSSNATADTDNERS